MTYIHHFSNKLLTHLILLTLKFIRHYVTFQRYTLKIEKSTHTTLCCKRTDQRYSVYILTLFFRLQYLKITELLLQLIRKRLVVCLARVLREDFAIPIPSLRNDEGHL